MSVPAWKEVLAESGWRRDLAALVGIVLLGALIYAHTLNVPWYLDDVRAIVENRTVHQLRSAFAETFSSGRGIADLTFALNYRFSGTEVAGYHLVNIGIHLATSCLAFLLLKRVFRERFLLVFGGALIFVAHPLQTQAITYIVQRMTSLAALFFFLAIYLYVRFRELPGAKEVRQWLLYGGALACGALAVLSKQNTAVLPVALLLFDRYYLNSALPCSWRRLLSNVAPFAVIPSWLAVQSLLLPMMTDGGIAHVGGLPDLVHLKHSAPLNYLVTEFSVVWLYLRLLFLPYGQALDYDVPIVATPWEWQNLIAFSGVAFLLAAAVLLRKTRPHVSAGIFWFFLGLAVESTFIPLDPVFEHRLYIPMFGFALAVMAGIAALPQRTAQSGIILLITLLAALTWQRNDQWNDPIAFHEENLRRAPRSERVHLDLANAYRRQGRLAEAEGLYQRALAINPDYVPIHVNLSLVYAAQKNDRKAVDILLEGLRRDASYSELYNNLGVLFNVQGRYAEAAAYLQKGVNLDPDNAMLHFNLALAEDRLGLTDTAITHYLRSIELDSANPMSQFSLGLALHRQGKLKEALKAFLAAARLHPPHAESLYNAAMICIRTGDMPSAHRLAKQLQEVNPQMASQLRSHLTRGRSQ